MNNEKSEKSLWICQNELSEMTSLDLKVLKMGIDEQLALRFEEDCKAICERIEQLATKDFETKQILSEVKGELANDETAA